MTIQEGQVFLNALAGAANVKSKHFSIGSLTTLALTKRKIVNAIKEYQAVIEELKIKVAMSDDSTRFIPISSSEEHVKDHKDFVKENLRLLNEEIEGLQLNFVPEAELKKVLEETTVEVATTLLIFLSDKTA